MFKYRNHCQSGYEKKHTTVLGFYSVCLSSLSAIKLLLRLLDAPLQVRERGQVVAVPDLVVAAQPHQGAQANLALQREEHQAERNSFIFGTWWQVWHLLNDAKS